MQAGPPVVLPGRGLGLRRRSRRDHQPTVARAQLSGRGNADIMCRMDDAAPDVAVGDVITDLGQDVFQIDTRMAGYDLTWLTIMEFTSGY
jgi:hypothetical protein